MKHLAFDMRIGELRIASEPAEQVVLVVVQIGSGLVTAIEGDRKASPGIAHGRAENGPPEIAGEAPDGRTGSDHVEAELSAAESWRSTVECGTNSEWTFGKRPSVWLRPRAIPDRRPQAFLMLFMMRPTIAVTMAPDTPPPHELAEAVSCRRC